MATLLVGAGWVICQILPEPIIALFGSKSSAFTDFAVKCLRIYLLFIFCSGFPIVSTNYFQATGQALKASILSMLRQLILPLFFGLDGVLYAAPAADILAAVIVLFFMIPEMKWLDRNCAVDR